MSDEFVGYGAGAPTPVTLQQLAAPVSTGPKSPEPTLLDTLGAAASSNFMGVSFLRGEKRQAAEPAMADPSFQLQPHDTEMLHGLNLTREEKEHVLGSTSRTMYEQRMQHVTEDRARHKTLEDAGMLGTVADFGSMLLDPTLLPALVMPGAGEAAAVGKAFKLGSRASKVLGMGAEFTVGGTIQAAIQAHGDSGMDAEDVIHAGLMAGALGLGFGAMTAGKAAKAFGGLDEVNSAIDKIHAIDPKPDFLGLPAPDKSKLPVLYDANYALEQMSSGAISAELPHGVSALLEYKGNLQARKLLEETNAMDDYVRKATASAELEKLQEKMILQSGSIHVMDELGARAALKGELQAVIDQAATRGTRAESKAALNEALAKAAAERDASRAMATAEVKGSGKALAEGRVSRKAAAAAAMQRAAEWEAKASEYTGHLAEHAKAAKATGDLASLEAGKLPKRLQARVKELIQGSKEEAQTILNNRMHDEFKATKLSSEIKELEAKLDARLNPATPKGRAIAREKVVVKGDKLTHPDKTQKEFSKETPFKADDPVLPPPDPITQDTAMLNQTGRTGDAPYLAEMINRAADEAPRAIYGGHAASVGARLSRSRFKSIRGLNALLNSFSSGAVKNVSAAVHFDTFQRQGIAKAANAQKAAVAFLDRLGFGFAGKLSEAAAIELDAFNNAVVLCIKGVKPEGEHADLIQQAAASIQDTFKHGLEIRKRSGVRGFEHVEVDGSYFSMLPKADKIIAMARKHGEDAVLETLKGAYLNGSRLGKMVDRVKAEKVAKVIAEAQVQRTINTRIGVQAAVKNVLSDSNKKFIKEQLEQVGMPKEEVDEWIAGMQAAEDKLVMSSRAKTSFGADMTHEFNGLRMVDLIDTDLDVALRYSREAAADASLAKVGFKSRADVDRVMNDLPSRVHAQAEQLIAEGHIDKAEAAKWIKELDSEKKLITDTMKQLYGHSLDADDYGKLPTWVKSSRMLRGVSSLVSLGWNGLASLPELGNVIANQGLSTVLQQLPKMKVNPAKFKELDPIMEEWSKVTGAYGHLEGWFQGSRKGTDALQELYDPISKAEKFVRTASEAQSLLSGFKHIQFGWEEMNLRSMVHNLDKAAAKGEISANMYRNFADAGLSSDKLDAVVQHLRSNRKQVKVGGITHDIADLDKIPLNLRDDFSASMTVQLNQAIQKQMIGEVPEVLNREFGRLTLQFLSFTVASIEKQLVRGIRTGPAKLVQATMWQAGIAYMAYMGLTWAHSKTAPDKDAYLENALSPRSVAYGVATRTGSLGALGTVFDGLASMNVLPDAWMRSPKQAGAQSLVRTPAAIQTPIRVATLAKEYAGHAVDSYNGELDDEKLAKTNGKALRTIPLINSAAVGFGYAALTEALNGGQ